MLKSEKIKDLIDRVIRVFENVDDITISFDIDLKKNIVNFKVKIK